MVLPGLVQKALLDANAFSIKPAPNWGFIVWKRTEQSGWRPIAQLPNQGAAEEFACEKLARLTE